MKTPIQEFYEFMEQNQYFIGNDLYNKYHELLDKEKDVMCEFADEYQRNCFQKSAHHYFDKLFNTKDVK